MDKENVFLLLKRNYRSVPSEILKDAFTAIRSIYAKLLEFGDDQEIISKSIAYYKKMEELQGLNKTQKTHYYDLLLDKHAVVYNIGTYKAAKAALFQALDELNLACSNKTDPQNDETKDTNNRQQNEISDKGTSTISELEEKKEAVYDIIDQIDHIRWLSDPQKDHLISQYDHFIRKALDQMAQKDVLGKKKAPYRLIRLLINRDKLAPLPEHRKALLNRLSYTYLPESVSDKTNLNETSDKGILNDISEKTTLNKISEKVSQAEQSSKSRFSHDIVRNEKESRATAPE